LPYAARLAGLSSLILGIAALSVPASAQVTVSEPPDFANSIAGVSAVTLGAGVNTISGAVRTPDDRQDNFQITVPTGHRLTAASVNLSTGGGFVGSVIFNLSDIRTSSGAFTMGLPLMPGTYYVQVITDFSIGNAWSTSFTVASATTTPVCGNGAVEAGETCDDGNAVECDGCSSTCLIVLDGCSIGGACVAEGAISPSNPCLACRHTVSRTTYSPALSGTSCDDGSFCTVSDACNGAGLCTGAARDCGDGLACTGDACDEAADRCDHPVTSGCLIAGACVAEGSADPDNPCMACIGATSSSAYSPSLPGTACDDAAYCTVSDSCDGAGACAGVARDCDDGDECTTDACDEDADTCATAAIPACEPDAGTSADAGAPDGGADAGLMPDGGSITADAGSITTDAGADVSTDADVSLDADISADAGAGPAPAAGCGCRAAGSSPSSAWALPMIALALWWRRSRRRAR
jgi:MYXO-CTERM domain-containing protein